jgi:hypothetical protein
VDYDGAIGVFYVNRPAGTPVPAVVAAGAPARRLRDAAEPVAMHAVWSRRVFDALAPMGLDFSTGYVWGRAAALGEPAAPVVAAAFAWFLPAYVAAEYDRGRAAAPRADLLAARDAAAAAGLNAILSDVDIAAAVVALRRGCDAGDVTGRPLFAGLSARPWPDDPAGQLWRACDILREHRGDSHIAAVNAAALDPVQANVLTELWLGMPLRSYTGTRGWSASTMDETIDGLRRRGLLDGDEITAAGRELRDAVEAATDAQEAAVVAAIGADLDAAVDTLDDCAARCIAAGAFPPDQLKRWAG